MRTPDVPVTVVAPAYNAQRTLDATLLSVRAQTHEQREIIIVVDGAIDATEDIARRRASEDSRVRVLVTENRGVTTARNAGAAAGGGAFIAPIDADDLWRPEKIARQLDRQRRFPSAARQFAEAVRRSLLVAADAAWSRALRWDPLRRKALPPPDRKPDFFDLDPAAEDDSRPGLRFEWLLRKLAALHEARPVKDAPVAAWSNQPAPS